jgi:hypothetical protein
MQRYMSFLPSSPSSPALNSSSVFNQTSHAVAAIPGKASIPPSVSLQGRQTAWPTARMRYTAHRPALQLKDTAQGVLNRRWIERAASAYVSSGPHQGRQPGTTRLLRTPPKTTEQYQHIAVSFCALRAPIPNEMVLERIPQILDRPFGLFDQVFPRAMRGAQPPR